jgi:hypothetical protein
MLGLEVREAEPLAIKKNVAQGSSNATTHITYITIAK